MNFKDLQEAYWNHVGIPNGDSRLDHMVQTCRDHINWSQDQIYMSAPYMWWMVREATLTPLTDTTVYTLDSYAKRAMEFWVEGDAAHKIMLRPPREVDRDGTRGSNALAESVGPYEMTWYPRTTEAEKDGTSAAISEAGTSLVKTTGDAFASTDVGKVVRLNGESADYVISAYSSATTVTLDRAYRTRLVGTGTSGVGAGISAKRYEVTPPGCLRVEIFGTSTGGPTINYRYQRKPRVMISDDETPEMPEDYHHIVLYGALMRQATFAQNSQAWNIWRAEFERAMENMLREERDQHDMESQARYESPIHRDRSWSQWPYGLYSRRGNQTTGPY